MTPPAPPLPTLRRKRAAARAALWWEQAWPAAWPALGLLGAYLCLVLLDLPALLPPWPRLLLLAAMLAGMAGLLARGVRRMRPATPDAADRRLERDTGLRHRPLAVLADRPAAPTQESAAVWTAHVARLGAQVARLRVARPRPGLARHDRRALRGGLVVALGACLAMAGPELHSRLLRGFAPGLPDGAPAPASVVQAWITPPAYTGLPPVFLSPAQPALAVPAGSHLVVSVTGGSGEPGLTLDGAATPFRALDASSWQAERDLVASGVLSVTRSGSLASAAPSWTLTVIPDLPPAVAFTDAPGPAQAGTRMTQQTRFPWRATDDYGLAGVQVELRLRDRAAAAPVVLPLPLAGSPKSAQGAAVQDLTAHPWAGLPVRARVVARDAPGQTGASADADLVLPERPFENAVARAVLDVRRQLSLTPEARDPARMTLDALADMPEAVQDSPSVLLNLRAIAALLRRGRGQAAVDEAQSRMWDLALALEEGAADRTAKALEAARQAVRDAVEAKPETPEAKAELDRRLQELREAIQKHMEALTEQARREGTELPFDPSAPNMNQRDLDRMAQRLQDAAKDGRMDDARQQMAELEKLLEQLQNARPEHGQAREQRNAERRERGKQQMDALQDMVRREGGLLDRSQGRGAAPEPRAPGPESRLPNGGPQRSPSPAESGTRQADGKSQRALRRALGELMQRFGDLTGQVPASLGEADTAMRDAGQALAEGRDAAAGSAQQRAIEALQKGGRDMGQQMARQFGTGEQPGEGEGEEGDGEPGSMGQGGQSPGRDGQAGPSRPGESPGPGRRRTARRDPLGRPTQQGASGSEDGGDVRVPDTMEQARTRAIQDELRRRGAERSRPQPELDYIDRLLKTY